MALDRELGNIPIEQSRIKSTIEKRLIQAPPDIQAVFPPVLRQGRALSAIISEPEYLMVAFLTVEQEKQFGKCISRKTNPFPGLITTGRERAACRVEKAICATARSCVITNCFSFSLGADSTIILEDHHQIIETDTIGTVSYTVPLAYIVSYGDDIDQITVYEYLENLVAYSINMWSEKIWWRILPESVKSETTLSRLPGIRN
jgi:hypothetical protein